MRNATYLVCLLTVGVISSNSTAQEMPDYVMYETIYLSVLPGHNDAFSARMAEHNGRFHGEGAHTSGVFYVLSGPRTGKLSYVMGPTTYTDLDSRPTGTDHDRDWGAVMTHCRIHSGTEYWRRNDQLSYTPENMATGARNLSRVRIFEVADNQLFIKTQGQIVATIKAMGGKQPRTMYRNQNANKDGRHWGTVTSYKNWAEMDEEGGGNFQEAFEKIYGDDAWDTFIEEIDLAIVSREDEWRQLAPSLGGVANAGSE